jgi:hypothetical protein
MKPKWDELGTKTLKVAGIEILHEVLVCKQECLFKCEILVPVGLNFPTNCYEVRDEKPSD